MTVWTYIFVNAWSQIEQKRVIFNHLKLWIAVARHNLKWLKINWLSRIMAWDIHLLRWYRRHDWAKQIWQWCCWCSLIFGTTCRCRFRHVGKISFETTSHPVICFKKLITPVLDVMPESSAYFLGQRSLLKLLQRLQLKYTWMTLFMRGRDVEKWLVCLSQFYFLCVTAVNTVQSFQSMHRLYS